MKDEILALNPPVSPRVSECAACVPPLCAHMHSYVFVFLGRHKSRHECEIDLSPESSVWIICSQRDRVATHISADFGECILVDNTISCWFQSLTQHIHFTLTLSLFWDGYCYKLLFVRTSFLFTSVYFWIAFFFLPLLFHRFLVDTLFFNYLR